MHAILNYTSMGLKRLENQDFDKLRKYLEHINISGVRLLRMFNALLDLAKLESGKFDLQFSHGDLAQIVASIACRMNSLFEAKQLRLDFEKSHGQHGRGLRPGADHAGFHTPLLERDQIFAASILRQGRDRNRQAAWAASRAALLGERRGAGHSRKRVGSSFRQVRAKHKDGKRRRRLRARARNLPGDRAFASGKNMGCQPHYWRRGLSISLLPTDLASLTPGGAAAAWKRHRFRQIPSA